MPFKNKTVIIAEDDYNLLMSLCIVLERLGYDAIPAENGAEVMQILRIISPDAITLDLNMPVLGGLETLKLIKDDERYKDIPVIVVSGESQTETIEECKRLGSAAFLQKPTGMADLNLALEKNVFPQRGRRYARISLDVKVTLNTGGASQGFYTRTLSESGVFVRTKHPFAVGTGLEIVLPMDGENITVRGSVIYVTSPEDLRPGMAIEFDNVPQFAAAKIREFVLKSISKDMEGLAVAREYNPAV